MFMQKLRQSMTVFLWFIAIVFILFIFFDFGANIRRSGSLGHRRYIAKVEGKAITYMDYAKEYQATIDRYYRGRKEIDPLEQSKISGDVLNQLIFDEINRSLGNQMHIHIEDKLVRELLVKLPPAEVLEDTVFYTDGKFDIRKYQSFLSDPRSRKFVLEYFKRLKDNIPQTLMNYHILAMIRPTKLEGFRAYIEDSVMVRLEYLYFPLKVDTSQNVDESLLREFFESHKYLYDNYGAFMMYAFFPIYIEEEDMQKAFDEAENILSMFKAGVSFDTLAYLYSDAESAGKMGDIGFVRIKDLPQEVQKALKGIKSGEVTRPVSVKDGVAIYYLVKREGNKVHLKEILIKFKPSYEKYMAVRRKAEEFVKSYKENPEMFLEKKKDMLREFIYHRYDVNPFGVNFGFMLYKARDGDVLPPLPGNGGIYVFIVKKNMLKEPDFEMLKVFVKKDYLKEKSLEKMYGEVAKLRSRMKDKIVPVPGAIYRKTGFFSMNQSVQGLNYRGAVYGAAFNLEPGKISPPIKDINGIYIIRVIERKNIDPGKINQGLLNKYLVKVFGAKRRMVMNELYREVIQNANIFDYRGDFSL